MFPQFPEVSCSEIRHRLYALSARSPGIADRAQTYQMQRELRREVIDVTDRQVRTYLT